MRNYPTYPASEKQVAFVTRLLGERVLTGSPFEGHTVAPPSLTGKQARFAIDTLMALPRLPREEQPEAEPGFYVREGDAFKVKSNKAGTHTYALVWSGTSWDYKPGAGRSLAGLVPMTGEQAAALGLASGRCIACAKVLGGESLSAKVSAFIGYGERCARKYGWDYPKGKAAQTAFVAEHTPAEVETNRFGHPLHESPCVCGTYDRCKGVRAEDAADSGNWRDQFRAYND